MITQGEIIVYQSEEAKMTLDVRLEDETVWLTQAQMVDLFQSTKQNISLHINNIFKEDELSKESTVKDSLTVQKEGSRLVQRKIELFNLDVIISVGYRVKSKRGTQFRIWANSVLKEYLLKGHVLSHRVDRIEQKLVEHEQKFDLLIKTALPPSEGIFFDGQIFDAYKFVVDLVKSTKSSLVLIDNYVDETVLTLFSKANESVEITIYTHIISKQFQLDIDKYNAQYKPLGVRTFTKSHDRFLIIDHITVYHIGASLKDLGKKWFAFSKMEMDASEIIQKLEK